MRCEIQGIVCPAAATSVIVANQGSGWRYEVEHPGHARVKAAFGRVRAGSGTHPGTYATEVCDALLQPNVGQQYADTNAVRNRDLGTVSPSDSVLAFETITGKKPTVRSAPSHSTSHSSSSTCRLPPRSWHRRSPFSGRRSRLSRPTSGTLLRVAQQWQVRPGAADWIGVEPTPLARDGPRPPAPSHCASSPLLCSALRLRRLRSQRSGVVRAGRPGHPRAPRQRAHARSGGRRFRFSPRGGGRAVDAPGPAGAGEPLRPGAVHPQAMPYAAVGVLWIRFLFRRSKCCSRFLSLVCCGAASRLRLGRLAFERRPGDQRRPDA